MIVIVHSIYSQSVHAPALDAGLMDNDAERYCTSPTEATFRSLPTLPSLPSLSSPNSLISPSCPI